MNTDAEAQQVKACRGDLVMVELERGSTLVDFRREVSTGYRLMKITNVFRDGRIKRVCDARYGYDTHPVDFAGMLYSTGRFFLLPAADWDVAETRRLAGQHTYPDSETPRDFPSLAAAREALAPARRVCNVTRAVTIPQPTSAADHTRCSHGQSDTVGYVVAYSRVNGDSVTFTDIDYVEGASKYPAALSLVREARQRIIEGRVAASYAVIHTVYAGGHRMV